MSGQPSAAVDRGRFPSIVWYFEEMDEALRRLRGQATTRVIRLEDDDGALDRDQWRGSTMAERIAAVWELTLEGFAWTHPDADEPRLQRSVCRIQRGGG